MDTDTPPGVVDPLVQLWPDAPVVADDFDPTRAKSSAAYRPAYFLRRLLEFRELGCERDRAGGTTAPRVLDMDMVIARARIKLIVALEVDRQMAAV